MRVHVIPSNTSTHMTLLDLQTDFRDFLGFDLPGGLVRLLVLSLIASRFKSAEVCVPGLTTVSISEVD